MVIKPEQLNERYKEKVIKAKKGKVDFNDYNFYLGCYCPVTFLDENKIEDYNEAYNEFGKCNGRDSCNECIKYFLDSLYMKRGNTEW